MDRATCASMTFVMLLCVLGGAPGCISQAQHQAEFAGVRTASQAEGKEYLAWSAALAGEPGAQPLPDLRSFSQSQRDAWFNARKARRDALNRLLDDASGAAPVAPTDVLTAPVPGAPAAPTTPAAPAAPAAPVPVPDGGVPG